MEPAGAPKAADHLLDQDQRPHRPPVATHLKGLMLDAGSTGRQWTRLPRLGLCQGWAYKGADLEEAAHVGLERHRLLVPEGARKGVKG